ncbi:ThiF family adenylyltransferase [Candidatus Woesearchaeota archaeon]|nr:ThiF family adenylyltransferase [Candidatus Woesearchaeota archaeon]
MRYTQHIKTKEIGEKGQKIIEGKNVAIVGLGNVGSAVAHILLRAGVSLRLIDKGRVDLLELASQDLYLEEDHSKFKAKQAKKYLEVINPQAKVRTFHEELTKNNIYLIDADVVIDATGDMETSKLISEETKKKKNIMIYTAVSGSKGIVATTDKGVALDKLKPTLAKMKPISEVGVVSPAIHMAASIIASKTLRNLLKKGSSKDIIQFDVWADTLKKSKA